MDSVVAAATLVVAGWQLVQGSEDLAALCGQWITIPGASTAILTVISSLTALLLRRLSQWCLRQKTSHLPPPSVPSQLPGSISVPVVKVGAALEWTQVKVAPVVAALLLQVFFAAVGASARLTCMLRAGPAILVFTALALSSHCLVTLLSVVLLNGLFSARMPRGTQARQDNDSRHLIGLRPALVASNANVGGPATAAAFAGVIGAHDLVVAATTWGTVGYAMASALGIGLYSSLLRTTVK